MIWLILGAIAVPGFLKFEVDVDFEIDTMKRIGRGASCAIMVGQALNENLQRHLGNRKLVVKVFKGKNQTSN
jgi:hypothetical protein